MPHSRRQHRGIWFLVAPADEPGYFYFEFEIGGRTVKRRTETNLVSLAIHRARRAIDRELKRTSEA
jgi:hypothetical protein